MNKIKKWALDFMKTAGYEEAYKIAKSCVESTSPSHYDKLPIGNIYYREAEHEGRITSEDRKYLKHTKVKLDNDKFGQKTWVLRYRELEKRHSFWREVLGVIRKELK